MGLRKIVLHNFKSYAGSLEIPFDGTPFVAIVGPNGSGKSNMLDAICFVIGMDSTVLRGSDLSELVHNGSKSKDMYVSALVSPDSGDEEVQFKRTASKFFVDDVEVSVDDYRSRWAGIKVFPDARNCIVLQGDIENLAGAEASDLAELIENMQASTTQSGLIKDREEYAMLKQEIEKASKETRKRASSRRAAQAEADEAMEISTAREKLVTLRSELKKLERRRKQLVLLEKRAMLADMRNKSEEAQAQLEACRTEAELVDADSRKLRSEYARKRRQLLNARNAEVEAQEALTAGDAEFAPLQKKQEAIETEQRLLEPDLEYAHQTLSTAEAEAKNAENALKLLDKTQDRNRKNEENGALGSLPKDVRDLWTKIENEFMAETALEQDKLDGLRRQAEISNQRLLGRERRTEDLASELNTVNQRVKQRELRVQQLTALVDERTTQQQQRREELQEVAYELLTLRAEQRDLTAKLRELSDKVRTTDGNKRAYAQRHRLLDAVERLRRSQKGKVHDLLGNLVEPTEAKFAGAVERALGGNADAIVVNDSETAIDCIAQARRERLGTLSFLPLSDLRNKDIVPARAQLAHQTARGNNEARLLLDCAQFDPKFRPAVVYALGDSVYAPTFAAGLDLRRSGLKMRIIDANGSTISANNIMSASPGENSASVASDRTLAAMQRKAHSIAEKLKAGSSRETELFDREIRLNAQIDRAVQTIEGAKTELRLAEEYLHTAESESANLENVLNEENESVIELQENAQDAQAKLNVHLEQVNSIREVKFASFISQAGGTLSEWDARFMRGSQQYAEFSRQRQRLEDRLQLAVERRDTAATQLTRQKQRAKALQTALQRVLDHKSRIETELLAARQRVERAQARVRSLRNETETKSDEVGNADEAVEAARLRVAEAEREEHRHALALAAEIGEEQAELDANNDSEDSHSSESESEQEKDTRASRKRKRQPATKAGKKGSSRETLSIDRLDTKIKDLRSEIEPLARLTSLINSESQDENASSASQRCTDLDETADAARSRLDGLATKLSELKQRRASRFNEALRDLQVTLSSVYSELVGGDAQAKLTPINTDEPFGAVEFVVMPPSKPFTPVSQLSGGERSMAALALLFSCQQLHPAPFVVLDEVDAALDFVNVASVSRYIRSHSSESQFIIVSLKQRLFQTASHLVGVYKEKVRSQVLTVPL